MAPVARGGPRTPLDGLDQAEIINYGCLNQHWMILLETGVYPTGGEAGAVPTDNNEMEQQETICHHPRISLPTLPQNMSLIFKIDFIKKVEP